MEEIEKVIAVIRKLVDSAAQLLPNDKAELHAQLDEVDPAVDAAPAPQEGPTAESAPTPSNAGASGSASDATAADHPAQ